jgi:glucokinase
MYIGLDVGGTNLKGARVEGNGQIVERLQEPVARESGQALLGQIAELVRRLAAGQKIDGVGIGVPGIVDHSQRRLRRAPNLAILEGLDVEGAVTDLVGAPAFVENDANAAGLAEAWLGAGHGVDSLVFVTLGTGVGGAVIVRGRLWTGKSGYAGEVGHMQIDPEGVTCGCGVRGCLETIAGNRHWGRIAAGLMRTRPSVLSGAEPDPEAIVSAARGGDGVALEVINTVARALGQVFGSIINLLNVERIVIGGGVSAAGGILLERIRQETSSRAWPQAFEACEFRIAQMGNDAGVVGAACVAMAGSQGQLQA